MRKIEIEKWALDVMDAVVQGRPSEWDSRVELKAVWPPDLHDLARRIAGHANAARGEPILWLFGVDEKGRKVPGVDARDPSTWWPQVVSCFAGEAPSPTFLTVRRGDAVVATIHFETDRAPFVVRNPAFGSAGVKIESEVPWRDAASLRTARREDLVRLLLPVARSPTFELQSLTARVCKPMPKDRKRVLFAGVGYLAHLAEQRICIPDHLARGSIRSASGGEMPIIEAKLLPKMRREPPRTGDRSYSGSHSSSSVSANPMFIRNDDDLIALGPGGLAIDAVGELVKQDQGNRGPPVHDFDDFALTASITVELRFGIIGADVPIFVKARLAPSHAADDEAAWMWDRTPLNGSSQS